MNIKLKHPVAIMLIALFSLASCATSTTDLYPSPQAVPTKYRTYYQLLVYSFADSNDDGIGDFKGIADKLEYLSDLGINGLWLSPINTSTSYHSYDVTDYYGIKSIYEVDGYTFEDLIDDAATYDIDIIMDLVINHSGRDHNWFISGLGAFKNNTGSKYKNWYNFSATRDTKHSSGNTGGYYEAIFWDGMPDFNFDNPEVREEMINIGKYWLAKGVAGFRLDAAMHIFTDYAIADKWNGDIYDKNIEWWQEFQDALASEYPDVYLIGEMWTNLEKIKRYHASNLDSAFNFETRRNIINAVAKVDGYASFLDDYQLGIREYQSDAIEAYFVSNHDDGRLASYLNNINNLKMAASLQLLAPGNAFIYYGDEIGLKGSGGTGDGLYRTPMRWGDSYVTDPSRYGIGGSYSSSTVGFNDVNTQLLDEDSLLRHYTRVLEIKNTYRELYAGTLTKVNTGKATIQAYVVSLGNTSTLVIHNTDALATVVSLSNVASLLASVSVSGTAIAYDQGQLTLPPQSSALLRLNARNTTVS
ncbi:MAG TPA: alpha-amylase family glycosyl hydrolase [Bacilli bacterium]|nr:alpha-amylase family glycosyl hydrolase [Bacilli bacterium]